MKNETYSASWENLPTLTGAVEKLVLGNTNLLPLQYPDIL